MSLEKLRLENLKRNAELFASFSLEELTSNMKHKPVKRRASTSGAVQKIIRKSKQPPRRSLRLINAPPVSMNEKELQNHVEEIKEIEKERHPVGPMDLSECLEEAGEFTITADDLTNETFGKVKRSGTWMTYESDDNLNGFVTQLKTNLRMSEFSVGKVTPKRVTCMDFHPSADQAIVLAGCSTGEMAFWDITKPELPTVMLKRHESVVSTMKTHPAEPLRVISTSYDGLLCVTDIEKQTVWEAAVDQEERFVSMDFLTATSVLKGSGSGDATITDLRESGRKSGLTLKCYSDRRCSVKSISVHPVEKERLVACATNGGTVILWDIRNSKKWLNCLSLVRCTQWCEFSPVNGCRLLTSSSSDQIRIYDTDSLISCRPAVTVPHNNQTGRYLTPFRPRWIPNREDCFVVGSMSRPRQAEIFNATTGLKMASIIDDELQSINSLWVYHPTLNILAGGNSSGRIHYFF